MVYGCCNISLRYQQSDDFLSGAPGKAAILRRDNSVKGVLFWAVFFSSMQIEMILGAGVAWLVHC